MHLSDLPTIPIELRELFRKGKLSKSTAGMAPGHAQANLVILPSDQAFDFLLFCQRNPKACPLIEVVEPLSTEPRQTAPGADLRTDLPKYRVYEYGKLVAEPAEISKFWRDDMVSFLLGCSFTFESALVRAGIHLPHFDKGSNVSMFVTNIQTRSAGIFSGPMVVSMRSIPHKQVVKAVQISSRFPAVHGAPIHIGNPSEIGIKDITKPDLGDPIEIRTGEVPMFWACGVTPQAVAMSSKTPFMITHSPGHMFITDKQDEDFSIL